MCIYIFFLGGGLITKSPKMHFHPCFCRFNQPFKLHITFLQIGLSLKYTGSTACLRTFAPIVSAHPYCARYSLRDVMPRHELSARAVEEMWRYIALVGTLISMHGFNSLKCSVTPYFLLIDHFLCRLSTFCEKLNKICIAEV